MSIPTEISSIITENEVLERSYYTARALFERAESELKGVVSQVEVERGAHAEDLKQSSLRTKSIEIFKTLISQLSERGLQKLIDLVNSGLATIFTDRNYKLKIEISDRGNLKTVEFFLDQLIPGNIGEDTRQGLRPGPESIGTELDTNSPTTTSPTSNYNISENNNSNDNLPDKNSLLYNNSKDNLPECVSSLSSPSSSSSSLPLDLNLGDCKGEKKRGTGGRRKGGEATTKGRSPTAGLDSHTDGGSAPITPDGVSVTPSSLKDKSEGVPSNSLRDEGASGPLPQRGQPFLGDSLRTLSVPLRSCGGGIQVVVSIILRSYFIMAFDQRRFLVLDESLTNLSEEYVEGLFAFLRLLNTELGFRVLFVSHDPRFLPYADRVYRVAEGNMTLVEKKGDKTC